MRHILAAFALALALLPTEANAGEAPWVHMIQLFGSDTDSQDSFGETVAIDGDTLAVAAYRKSGGGAVYIFERSPEPPTEWVETKKLSPQTGDTFFGLLLAIDGNTLAVMAEVSDGEALYLFERDLGGKGAWGLVGRFQAEEVSSLGLDEDTLSVGNRDFGQFEHGAVHILERGPDGPADWEFVSTLTASDADAQDFFGDTQALSSERLLVGAPSEDDFGNDSGAAYVFERDEEVGEWVEIAKLLRPGPAKNDNFGWSTDLDVATALVGVNAGPGRDAAFVFERDDRGHWAFTKELRPFDEQEQGFSESVGLSGDVAAVGAPGHKLDGTPVGAVYVFERHAGGTDAWGEVATLLVPDPQDLDRFGDHVALDRNTLVVGVDEDDDAGFDAGTVYLFSRTEPLLSIAGSCPGELSVSVIGTTPSSRVVLLGAESGGVTPIPSGPCVGREVDLALPKVVFDGTATSGGDLLLTPEVGPGTCGRLVQAVDIETCLTTEVVEVR